MHKITYTIVVLICCTSLCSFFKEQPYTPEQKIKQYYKLQFEQLSAALAMLQTAVEKDSGKAIISKRFLQSRLVYKKLELILEYYFEGDVKRFNGLATPFIEEEDPAAYQEPQGFQMIETFIYPVYNSRKKTALLQYIRKLSTISKGLSNNATLFNPQQFMPDAVMEELYRILALGISGFDSPLAELSIPEAASALESIHNVLEIYQGKWQPVEPLLYKQAIACVDSAIQYLQTNCDFNRFNRAKFITSSLNPLCDAIAGIKSKTGNRENELHYSLIKRTGNLFAENSLDQTRYLYDDKISSSSVSLGKILFYEPMLSANNKRSCASCHQPAKAFTDGLRKALQQDGHSTLPRNTPTLWNAALQINLFYDSRHLLPEDVITEVLGNKMEMNSGAGEAMKRLQTSRHYQSLFQQVYGSADTALTAKNAANAIAMYLRTLVSYRSRFDAYMRGEKDKMNTSEINGFNLFMGKAKCGTCHYTPLFNGSKPPNYYYQESEVLGVPANTDTIHPILDKDPGRITFLKLDFLNHAFKTPTLRNIAITAPYMHNGVYKTLEEVIDFYNRGGGQGLRLHVPNQTLPADKLQLTATEKKDLKSFLLTLTDTSAVH